MAADFQNPSAALPIGGGMAESRVKKTCVMHAKLADHGQIGGHFSGIFRRYRHGLLAHQYVERPRVQYNLLILRANFFPKISWIIGVNFAKIDHAGMRFGAIAYEAVATGAEVHREPKPILDDSLARDQRRLRMQFCERIITEHRMTQAKANLIEAHAGPHQN